MKSKNYFDPFGIKLLPINSTDNRMKYTGQERDTFTNYDYMHFRFYASSMGRFLKPDNIIPDITNPQNWNAYTYVKGNPINFNDPSGHGPNVPSYPAYIPNTHSFGMSWFDQFREGAGYLPWFGQTEENSLYWDVPRVGLYPMGVDYGFAAIAPQDYAMLANAAYDPYNSILPAGWDVCEAKTWNSGLRAAAFYNSQTGDYVVAFAGVDQPIDIANSIRQMTLGHSKQFSEARDYVKAVMENYGCTPTLVGHSLGGGLAAAVAIQLGLQARTFNAEGVNARTVGGRAALVRAKDLVINYFTGGDWLTTLQQLTPLPNAAGRQVYVGPGGHRIRWFVLGP